MAISRFVFLQYENMKDEDEGFKMEDIENFYISDEENDSKYPLHQLCSVVTSSSLEENTLDNAQEQPALHTQEQPALHTQEEPVLHTQEHPALRIQEHPALHTHRVHIHNSAMNLPHDILIDAGLTDYNTHVQHNIITLRRTKPTASNSNDNDVDDFDDSVDDNDYDYNNNDNVDDDDDDNDYDYDNDDNVDDDDELDYVCRRPMVTVKVRRSRTGRHTLNKRHH